MTPATAAFLQETLRPISPVIPRVEDPRDYLDYGLGVGSKLQSIALQRQNLALNQAKVDLLPLDRKYSTALQNAQIARLNTQAENDRAHAALLRLRANPTPYTPSSWNDDPDAPTTAQPPDDLPVADGSAANADLFQSAPEVPLLPSAPFTLQSTAPASGDDETASALSLGGSPAPTSVPVVPSLAAPSAPPISGLRTATVFGRNMDGSIDKEDNGKTAFGDDSRDPNARIASVTFAEARQRDLAAGGPGTLAHFKTLPAELRTVSISNPANGRSTTAEIRELGPSEDAPSGATLDLTPTLMKEVGGTGKDKLAVTYTGGLPQVPRLPGAAGAEQIANDPLVEVHGAEDPSAARVVGGSSGGFQVPQNEQEVNDLHAKLGRKILREERAPGYDTDPKVRAAVANTINLWKTQAKWAEDTYNTRQRSIAQVAARNGRTSSAASPGDSPLNTIDPGTGLPVIPGFTPGHIKVTNGKINYDQLSPNDIADEKEQSRQAALDRLSKEIARETHGGTPDDLLMDRGNYSDTDKKETPGIRYYMQAIEDPDTKRRVLAQQPMAEGKYRERRNQLAALGVGDPFDAPTASTIPGLQPVSIPGVNMNMPASSPALRPVNLKLGGVGRTAVTTDFSAPVIPSRAAPTAPPPVATPSPESTDPEIRLAALRQAAQQQAPRAPLAGEASQSEIDDEASATRDALDAGHKADADAEKQKQDAASAQAIAEKFDFNSIKRPFLQNDDGTVVAGAGLNDILGTGTKNTTYAYDPLTFSRPGDAQIINEKVAQAAKAAGIKKYDIGAVVKALRARRAQEDLDRLSASADPSTVASANTLAAYMQSHGGSLPTGFGQSSVGATDRVIPNSGK